MYATYTTEALVCGSKVHNTSDKNLLLFTQEAGMLFGSVRSMREERSRQRYALQDFSLVRVSLVKGKAGWRVGSVTSLTNYYQSASDRESRGGVVAIIKLLRQFVHGEESHPALYRDTVAALEAMSTAPEGVAPHYRELYTYRLLYHLGYIAREAELTALLADDVWSDPAAVLIPKKATAAVENAIRASHL